MIIWKNSGIIIGLLTLISAKIADIKQKPTDKRQWVFNSVNTCLLRP